MDTTSPSSDGLTHFGTTTSELPVDYYVALGAALYRWSQLEGVVCNIAATTMNIPLLEAFERLRGKTGFKLKNVFQQLDKAVNSKGLDTALIQALRRAEKLYEQRKTIFHSVWGIATGSKRTAVAIQEWSHVDYSNFREIPLNELEKFTADCLETWIFLLKNLIPHLHGASAVSVDDADGFPKASS
jgi:hypothetical protein